MPVPVDFTINKIIDNIYKKLDGKISKEVIQEVINFQSLTIRQGIEEGDDIHIRYLGSFKFNHKRAFKLQESGKDGSMKVEQKIVQKEGSKSWKVKETRRIVFKKV